MEAHGDLSCNIAMLLTKQLKKKPRDIAQEIIDAIEIDQKIISKVEIAGPGFINFFFQPEFITEIIKIVMEGLMILKEKKPMLNLFQRIRPDR